MKAPGLGTSAQSQAKACLEPGQPNEEPAEEKKSRVRSRRSLGFLGLVEGKGGEGRVGGVGLFWCVCLFVRCCFGMSGLGRLRDLGSSALLWRFRNGGFRVCS